MTHPYFLQLNAAMFGIMMTSDGRVRGRWNLDRLFGIQAYGDATSPCYRIIDIARVCSMPADVLRGWRFRGDEIVSVGMPAPADDNHRLITESAAVSMISAMEGEAYNRMIWDIEERDDAARVVGEPRED